MDEEELQKFPAYQLPANLGAATDERACEDCLHFSSGGMAYPGGWCAKYPSRKVNTGAGMVCPLWEGRTIEFTFHYDPELLEGQQ